jgi:hypothetical protein
VVNALPLKSLTVAALVLAACSSHSTPPAGKTCHMNSECSSPLLCTYGYCHIACAEARDCLTGELCVKGAVGSVCQLPVESHCTYRSDCMAPLACALDRQCRSQCRENVDCPTSSQRCVLPGGVCAEPDEIDPTTNLLKRAMTTPVPDRPDDAGGSDDAAAGAGADAGADAAADASADTGGCATGAAQCMGKKQSICMNGLWVTANNDCEEGCDSATGRCRMCPLSTCQSARVIFHGAIDQKSDVELAVDDGSVFRTSSDTDPTIGQKNVLFGNFTEDKKQYTTDNTACTLPDYGKRTNVYYLARLDGLAVASTWYSSADDFATVKTCAGCPNFSCENYISTPKRIDKVEVLANSGDLSCKVCLYRSATVAPENLIRCLSPNTSLAGSDLAPTDAPVLLQLDDGKHCAAY